MDGCSGVVCLVSFMLGLSAAIANGARRTGRESGQSTELVALARVGS